jgi:chromosome segregation ATPase
MDDVELGEAIAASPEGAPPPPTRSWESLQHGSIPPPIASPRAPKAVPDMQSRPYGELAPLCRDGLARVEKSLSRFQSLSSDTLHYVSDARKVVAAVDAAGRQIEEDQQRIATIEEQGREYKANFGRALDELGRDASRASGWVMQIERRAQELKAARAGAAKGDGFADAMLWEQAAMEEEGLRARAVAKDLSFQLETLRAQLQRHSEGYDAKLVETRAKLEGHVAALRTLAKEAWSAIDGAAEKLGVSPMPTEPPAPA